MFGLFRFALAWEVVTYHLSDRHPVGWYSVYAFYALSGYLMTLVIGKKYALSPAGGMNFLINRALRIYPPYLAMAAVAWVLLNIPALAAIAPHVARTPPIGLPAGAASWFSDVFILGWHMPVPKLVPQVWSVYREIFYCSIIYFIFARSRRIALAWFAASAAYALWTIWRGYVLFEVYNSFAAASLSYSAGCCLYHFRDRLRILARPLAPLLALAVLLPFALEFVRPHFFREDSAVPFYLNVAFSAYLVLVLSTLKPPPRLNQFDQYLGNLAYPIYLCHFNVAIVLAALAHASGFASDRLLLMAAGPVLLCAWLVNKYIERTIGYGYDKRRQAARATDGRPAPAAAPAPSSAPATVMAIGLRPESE